MQHGRVYVVKQAFAAGFDFHTDYGVVKLLSGTTTERQNKSHGRNARFERFRSRFILHNLVETDTILNFDCWY